MPDHPELDSSHVAKLVWKMRNLGVRRILFPRFLPDVSAVSLSVLRLALSAADKIGTSTDGSVGNDVGVKS